MGLEEQWKVFSDLILLLRKKGTEIPKEVMKDLHSAKIMISLLGKKGSDESETMQRIETYLSSVEGFLYYAAEEKLGKSVAAEWMERISRARRTPGEETKATPTRGKFIAGLRRGEGWVRIEEYNSSLSDAIKTIAREEGLEVTSEPSGHMLIRGDGERIRQAMKRIRQKARRRSPR